MRIFFSSHAKLPKATKFGLQQANTVGEMNLGKNGNVIMVSKQPLRVWKFRVKGHLDLIVAWPQVARPGLTVHGLDFVATMNIYSGEIHCFGLASC